MGSVAHQGRTLTELMIDIDFFKRFNDTFGHVEGDRILMLVAKGIQKSLFRLTDSVARFGGEEFVVILPDMNAEHGSIVAERIRTSIVGLLIPFASETGEYLTVSIGCFSGSLDSSFSADQFVKNADAALYLAKAQGRNCVSIYSSGCLVV